MNAMWVGYAYGVSRSVWDGVVEEWKAEATVLFFVLKSIECTRYVLTHLPNCARVDLRSIVPCCEVVEGAVHSKYRIEIVTNR